MGPKFPILSMCKLSLEQGKLLELLKRRADPEGWRLSSQRWPRHFLCKSWSSPCLAWLPSTSLYLNNKAQKWSLKTPSCQRGNSSTQTLKNKCFCGSASQKINPEHPEAVYPLLKQLGWFWCGWIWIKFTPSQLQGHKKGAGVCSTILSFKSHLLWVLWDHKNLWESFHLSFSKTSPIFCPSHPLFAPAPSRAVRNQHKSLRHRPCKERKALKIEFLPRSAHFRAQGSPHTSGSYIRFVSTLNFHTLSSVSLFAEFVWSLVRFFLLPRVSFALIPSTI